MTDTDDTQIGLAVHGMLRASPEGRRVLSGLLYADRQMLKTADRAGLLELLHGSEYAVIQQLKNGTPEEIASLLIEQVIRAQDAVTNVCIMVAGITLMNLIT